MYTSKHPPSRIKTCRLKFWEGRPSYKTELNWFRRVGVTLSLHHHPPCGIRCPSSWHNNPKRTSWMQTQTPSNKSAIHRMRESQSLKHDCGNMDCRQTKQNVHSPQTVHAMFLQNWFKLISNTLCRTFLAPDPPKWRGHTLWSKNAIYKFLILRVVHRTRLWKAKMYTSKHPPPE